MKMPLRLLVPHLAYKALLPLMFWRAPADKA
jgi:hypothetical protein